MKVIHIKQIKDRREKKPASKSWIYNFLSTLNQMGRILKIP